MTTARELLQEARAYCAEVYGSERGNRLIDRIDAFLAHPEPAAKPEPKGEAIGQKAMSLELPPLQQAKIYGSGPGVNPQQLFTEEETRAYARQAQRMALEEAAKVCSELWFIDGTPTANEFAAEIRKLAEQL